MAETLELVIGFASILASIGEWAFFIKDIKTSTISDNSGERARPGMRASVASTSLSVKANDVLHGVMLILVTLVMLQLLTETTIVFCF